MLVIRSVAELVEWRQIQGPQCKVGFVPTMGALHAGHASLLSAARQGCDLVVLSIFVNPTQFGPNEDFEKYPRTLDADLALAQHEGVDVVFAPSPGDFYPPDFSTQIREIEVSSPLCGPFRPGHFQGVTTVVLKLLNLVRPSQAYFGLKDLQQFLVIKKMVEDLSVGVTIVGIPTLREPDGLAMSSRNLYLSPEDRALAPSLYKQLTAVRDEALANRPLGPSIDAAKTELTSQGFKIQYLEMRVVPSLTEASAPIDAHKYTYCVAAAVYLGKTRLIDNILFGKASEDMSWA